jgi:hypothetical protein
LQAKAKQSSKDASYAGLTRVSIIFAKSLSKMMDGRVKPGHDERKQNASLRSQ